jgi:hypothetical protein
MVNDPAAFIGQEARLIGFVYRDDRFNGDEFMISRFVISCCAADAAPLGLVVRVWSLSTRRRPRPGPGEQTWQPSGSGLSIVRLGGSLVQAISSLPALELKPWGRSDCRLSVRRV